MRFRKILSGLRAKYWKTADRIIDQDLLGVKLKVIRGTRVKEDYDDAWFYLLAKHSNIFFDVGANIGYTALLASIAGAKKIVLIDPNPEALSSAAKNMILNSLSIKCHFINAFVSAKPGEKVKFYSIGYGAAGSMYSSHAQTASILNSYFMVDTTTLDELCKSLELEPDFAKVDVEGAEFLVLEGATELVKNARTRFLVEMHATKEVPMVENAASIMDWCTRVGYQVWYLKEEVELIDPLQISQRGKCHLLLQPYGWDFPNFLKGIKEGSRLNDIVNIDA